MSPKMQYPPGYGPEGKVDFDDESLFSPAVYKKEIARLKDENASLKAQLVALDRVLERGRSHEMELLNAPILCTQDLFRNRAPPPFTPTLATFYLHAEWQSAQGVRHWENDVINHRVDLRPGMFKPESRLLLAVFNPKG